MQIKKHIIYWIIAAGLFWINPAQARDVFLEWKPVAGAQGYQIQVRNLNNKIVFRQTTRKTRIALNLPRGHYSYRLGSLNRFQKVGSWSAWRPLEIIGDKPNIPGNDQPGTSDSDPGSSTPNANHQSGSLRIIRVLNTNNIIRVLGKNLKDVKATLVSSKGHELRLSRLENGNHQQVYYYDKNRLKSDRYDIVLQAADGSTARATAFVVIAPGKDADDASFWSALIPGLPQIQRGETDKGYAYMALAIALGGVALAENNSASKIAAQKNNDIFYNLYNNPTWVLLFNNQVPNNILLAYWQNQQGVAKTNQYDTHIRNRNIAAGGLVILYVFHIIDAFFSAPGGLSMPDSSEAGLGFQSQAYLYQPTGELIQGGGWRFSF